MYLIREVLNCRPGQVGAVVKKFKAVGAVVERLGFEPFRLFTDVSGERFWTLVVEREVEDLGGFAEMEAKVMADPEAQQAMSGYHDLVLRGRREIYKVEG